MTGTDLEISTAVRTDRIRREVDDLAQRIRTVCPDGSRIRTAGELRGMAQTIAHLRDHVSALAEKMEAGDAR